LITDLATLRATEQPDIPYRVTLTEVEVIEVVMHRLGKEGPLPVSDVQLTIQSAVVDIRVETNLLGMPVQAAVSCLPRAEPDGVQLDIYSIDLNGAPAPGFIRSQVVAKLNERLTADQLPLVVHSVELADGVVTIAGLTK
jgi:hypothetical protein